ncbi:hypothetical protein EDB81DRAFT_862179 [Dactylonectria macrodidyma]|uniref:Myb-like domain-containing protein n=1 Tax=Dactylonectria macrodidyma TaxID=307937 RepID=A0A9P9ID61_9HYPO|nr:hypothetical protein EDB81DRAFT_862179 [Dactylonectria macrodidyma]
MEADHCGDIVESTPTESGFGYASPYPTVTSLSSGSTTPSTPPSPSLLSKDETLQNPIQAQAGGTSGQSGLGPMAMDLSQHASSTQEPEVCSSGKQPVDDMRWGRDRRGGDVEPCSTGLGGSRAQAPRRRARGSYMLHGDYYESDDSDGDDNDDNDERGQQSLELDGVDRSRRCSGSIPIEALLDDAKYRPAQSTEDSERDHNGDEDEDEDEAYGKRRGKRRRSHEPLASIKRRRYGYTTRQRPANNTRSVPSDRTPASRMLSPSSSYTTSDDSNTGHDFATFQERRKVSRPSAGLLRNAAVNVERPRRGRPSLRSRSTQSTYRGKNTQARGILSPMSSQATSDETEVKAVLASFEEWPLENVSLKRITENGKTTFQVQFDWTPCTKHGHASSTVRDRVDLPSTRTRSRAKRGSAPRAKYTQQEDGLLIELKESKEMLAWPEIHQRFCEAHPGRSVESLQVHYSTKLKSRERL